MRWLYLITFAIMHAIAFGQEKEISISPDGLKSNISSSDVSNPVNKFADSLRLHDLYNSPSSVDDLQQIAEGQKILSQRQWKHIYDSLIKTERNILFLSDLQKKEVTEDELIKALNSKFYEVPRDSILQSKQKLDDKAGLLNRSITESTIIPDDELPLDEVSDLKLPIDDLQNLSPLPASVIKSKYLAKLDSIRKINLAKENLSLLEKEIFPGQVVSEFSQTQGFWDKTYFEGVFGFTPGEFKILQASPTLGYHFTPYLSAGLGPNILVQERNKQVLTTVGIKTFFKAEFLKRQVYFQMEDIMDSYGTLSSEKSQRNILREHNIFIGGGFLLDIRAPVTLNFSVLYCITESETISSEFSPMVFRIGLSSLKVKK